MRSGVRKKLDDLILGIESMYRKHSYRKKAKLRLKRMKGGYKCDKEYSEIVVPYWKKFGYKPKKYWYQIFSDREQKVDPRYIPDDLYYGEIIPYFSNSLFRRYGEDKCYHDVWFKDIKRPKTLFKNIAGIFYDGEMNIIDKDMVIKISKNYSGEFLIKPSIDSGEGRLIKFFDAKNLEIDELVKFLDDMASNYIAQEAFKQHEALAELNPTSLNTIRIVSFLFKEEVHILSAIFRVGAPNSRVDNVGAGGFACPIKEDGQLNDKAVNRKAEWVKENTQGVKFSDIKIPHYKKVRETVIENHKKLAHFKLVGWDMSVDSEGNPIFIEYNTCPGSNQITCGPTFGNITEEVLKEFFIEKKYNDAQN